MIVAKARQSPAQPEIQIEQRAGFREKDNHAERDVHDDRGAIERRLTWVEVQVRGIDTQVFAGDRVPMAREIRVLGTEDEHEYLRFDMFNVNPHYHYEPPTEKERRPWLKEQGLTTNYAWWVAERAEGRGWGAVPGGGRVRALAPRPPSLGESIRCGGGCGLAM